MPELRPAVAADAGEILTVQRAAFVSEAQVHDDVHMPPLTETLDGIRGDIDAAAVVVALDGQRIVGSVRARVIDEYWHLARLSVAPDVQRRGIGSALIRAVEALAPDHVQAFSVETGPRSDSNVALYRQHGYAVAPNDTILIRLTKARETTS